MPFLNHPTCLCLGVRQVWPLASAGTQWLCWSGSPYARLSTCSAFCLQMWLLSTRVKYVPTYILISAKWVKSRKLDSASRKWDYAFFPQLQNVVDTYHDTVSGYCRQKHFVWVIWSWMRESFSRLLKLQHTWLIHHCLLLSSKFNLSEKLQQQYQCKQSRSFVILFVISSSIIMGW